MLYLFPKDPSTIKNACDPHFREEHDACLKLGHQTGLIDHDLLTKHNTIHELDSFEIKQIVKLTPGVGSEDRPQTGPQTGVVYRGWMVTVQQYQDLEQLLAEQGIGLRTTSGQYQTSHQLPGWYKDFQNLTPQTTWGHEAKGEDVSRLLAGTSNAYIIRDWVKSEKHHWEEACYIPENTDAGRQNQIGRNLVEYRGNDFTGGIVCRRFEQFQGHELRSWWVNGELKLTSAHPDTPEDTPDTTLHNLQQVLTGENWTQVREAVQTLNVSFCCVDLVAGTTRAYWVVEVGDGQVSDRPKTMNAETFIEAIS